MKGWHWGYENSLRISGTRYHLSSLEGRHLTTVTSFAIFFHINIAEAKHINAGLLNYSLNFAVQSYAPEQNLINLFCQNKRKLKTQQGCSWTPTENMELTLYHSHRDTGACFKQQITWALWCSSFMPPTLPFKKNLTAALSERFFAVISLLFNLSCDYFDHVFQFWITLSSALWAVLNAPWVNYWFTAISCLEAGKVSCMSPFPLLPEAALAQLVRSDAYTQHVLLTELSTAL